MFKEGKRKNKESYTKYRWEGSVEGNPNVPSNAIIDVEKGKNNKYTYNKKPKEMKKVFKLKESDLRNMVMESVRRFMLEEREDIPNDMHEFFTPEQMNEPADPKDEVDADQLFDFEGPDYDNMSDYMCEGEDDLPPQLGPWHRKKQNRLEKNGRPAEKQNYGEKPFSRDNSMDEAVSRAMKKVLGRLR